MSTATKSTVIKEQPIQAQVIKSDSFKRCATSLLSKFSLSSIKPEQVLRRRGSITLKKSPIEIKNDSNMKRKLSNLSVSSIVENRNENDIIKSNSSNLSPPSSPLFKSSPQLNGQGVTYGNNAGDELLIKLSAHKPEYRVQPVTMLSELGQEVQIPQHTVPPDFSSLSLYFESNLSIDAIEYNRSRDIRPPFIRQASVSTPIKTCSIDKNLAAVSCIEEENPGLSYIHSNSASDDEEVTTPTTSILSDQETWPSTDEGIESSTILVTRYKRCGSVDLTSRIPARTITNANFNQSTQKRNTTLCFSDHNNNSQKSLYTSTNHVEDDSLDRSASINSSSSASSSGSISNKNDKKENTTSGIPKFGKSEVQKKMLKANTMWRINVQTQLKKTDNEKLILKDVGKDQAIGRFIINELYSTEKSFYQFLIFIRSNYMEPMQIASRSKNPLVKSHDIYVLFNPLLELITMSEYFLVKLEEYIHGLTLQHMSPGIAIGYIFKELENYLGAFLKYAVHYRCHFKAIRRASNTGYILKIDRKSKALKKENNRLGLADYLIAPFQRVPRYGLLIKDLLRHTETTIPNVYQTNDLIYAKRLIDALAITMNQVLEEKNSKLSSFYNQTLSSYIV